MWKEWKIQPVETCSKCCRLAKAATKVFITWMNFEFAARKANTIWRLDVFNLEEIWFGFTKVESWQWANWKLTSLFLLALLGSFLQALKKPQDSLFHQLALIDQFRNLFRIATHEKSASLPAFLKDPRI